MKFKLVILFMLLLTSNTVFAAGSCNTVSCVGKVKTIYPNGDSGLIYLKSDGDMSQLNCTLNQGRFIVLKETNSRYKEIYSMLLSAQLAQTDVTMRIRENTPDCELIYTMINMWLSYRAVYTLFEAGAVVNISND